MLFSVLSNDLDDALELLKPIPKRIKKKDTEEEVYQPEFSYEDKLTFELHKDTISLLVSCDGVRVRKEISALVKEINVRFCVSFFDLYRYVRSDNRILVFEEIRFFGFNVYDQKYRDYNFDIEAFSARTQKKMISNLSDFSFNETVTLEKDFLLNTFSDISVYGNHDSKIVYQINDGKCIVAAYDRVSMGLYRYPTIKKKKYLFFIPNKLASDGLLIIEKIENSSISLYYNKEYLYIFGEDISIELEQSNDFNAELIERVLSVHDITGHFTVRKKSFEDFLKKADILNEQVPNLIIHGLDEYITIHCYDYIEETGIHEIALADNCVGDLYLDFSRKTFVKFMKLIQTENIQFFLAKNGLIYVLSENEDIKGDILRILSMWSSLSMYEDVIKKESNELIEKFRAKKLQATKDDDQEIKDSSDEETDCGKVTDEMKKEAIIRMKNVISCSSIIASFEETGQPQVYEPPYGASYFLEDEEVELVRKTESLQGIMIWGVIRCSMTYNQKNVTVDCMLYVSKDKGNWEQERKDLYDFYPSVYTVMKEFPVKDHGHITVTKSPGGTLLRVF